jgi:hypothetical protein
MNIESESPMYLFSGEGKSEGLPIQCEFIKFLPNSLNKDVALIKIAGAIKHYPSEYIVVVPKHENSSFIEDDSQYCLIYILDGSHYVSQSSIDLTNAKKHIIDWGGITVDEKLAEKYQYS